MGILDTITSSLTGAQGACSMRQSAVLGQLVSTLRNGQPDGIGGLIQNFEQAGLGPVMQSWIGSGQNLPIAPDQLQRVLGYDRIEAMAQSLGLQHSEVAQHLAALLPQLIDQLTPAGQLPQGSELPNALAAAAQKLIQGRGSGSFA